MNRVLPIPETVTVHVPFRLVKRGGRKEMVLPVGASNQRNVDNPVAKAIARAFRWQRMLATGEFATISELADREGIALSYLSRVLRLTLLAPDILEAILDGRLRQDGTMAALLEPFPTDWPAQRERFQ